MSPDGETPEGNVFDKFDDAPKPVPDEQANAAAAARETAGQVPRRRARPQETPAPAKPAGEGENSFDQFDSAPNDDGVALMERLRLNRQESFYRGSLAGSARLALLAKTYQTPDGPDVPPKRKKVNQGMRDEYVKIVSDLAAHDEMKPWGTTLEAAAAFGGQLEGTMISPEAWIGWGAKGASWMWRTAKAGFQQAGIQAATDPIVQGLDISAGVQDEYDPRRTAVAGATGFGIGGGAHVIGEGLGKVVGQHQLRKQLFDLGTEDAAFDAPRHAVWALDPNNGIAAPEMAREGLPAVREPYASGPAHGFADTVSAETERLSAEGAKGPKLKETARFNAFDREAGPILDAAIKDHSLDPEHVRYGDIWKFYDRQPGQSPHEALEGAIGKWVSEEEARAMAGVIDSEMERDLAEWSRAYDAERERMQNVDLHFQNTESGRYDITRQSHWAPTEEGVWMRGTSAVLRDYRPHHLPEEDIPFDHPQTHAAEGGDLSARGGPQPGEKEGIAGSGAEPPVRGERGGGGAAGNEAAAGGAVGAEGQRGERVEGPAVRPASVPKEVPDAIYSGWGRVDSKGIYNGTDFPVAGPGTYFSFSQEHAKTFGPNVHKATIGEITKNPLVIRSDDDWRALTKEAGWQVPNPFGKSKEDMAKLTADLQRIVKDKGHDGIVVWFNRAEKTDRDGTHWIKLLRNTFDEPQVIGFEKPLATERTAHGEQTLMPGVEPVTDKARVEAQMAKPLRGGEKGMPEGGLFDEGARAQGDIFAREIPDEQEIARRRKGGKMDGEPERVAVEKPEMPSPEEDVAIRSLQQQSMDIAKALDFPLREGRVQSRKAAGVFKSNSGVVRVREVPDFDVVSHEAGHALEAKVGKDLTDLTKAHAVELRPLDYDQTDKGKRVNEGFAEFVRLMMTNPAYAERKAPTFALEFRQFMAAREPEMLAKLDQAAAAYKAYLDAPSVDAVGSVRRSVDDDPKGIAKVAAAVKEDGLPLVIKSVIQKSYDAVLDDKAPFARTVRELGVAIRDRTGKLVDLKAADNPEMLLRMLARSRQAATRDLMDGVRPYHEIGAEGPSLSDAISEAIGSPSVWGKWDEGKKAEFDTYLIARRAHYLWRKFEAGEIPNPPVAFSKADAQMAMDDLVKVNRNFINAGGMVHEYNLQLLRKSYEGGLLPADLYQRLLKEEFYVPFMRDMSDRPNIGHNGGPSMGGEGPGTTAIVKRLRGSARDIKSPLESIMAQTFTANRTLRHNDVVKAFVDLAKQAGPEGGKYVEPIPAHEARKYAADLEQAIENRAKDIGMDPDEAKNILAALGDPEGGPIAGSYFKMEQAAAKGEPIVFYREGGELKAARFMSESEGHGLYELLTAAPEPVTDLWVQMLGTAATIKRTGIISNPTFAITNYFRDQVAASILRSDYVPIVSGLKGLRDEFRQGQNAVLYGYAGGVAGGAGTGPVEHAIERDIDALKRKGFLVQRLGPSRDAMVELAHGNVAAAARDAKEGFKQLLELASFTEAGTRNSIFDTVFQASKRKGLSDYEAMVEAAFQAQDLLDFSRHGSRTIAIRNLLPFLNAHMQGLDKARRTMIEPITNRIREGKVFEKDTGDFNNALAAWTKAGALGGALGAAWAAINWESEAYRDASPYFKGTHLVVPWGNKIVVVPKPFELGIGFTAGEYAFHALSGKDPRAARMFAEAAWQALQPPNPFTDIPVLSTTAELLMGKSLFTGRDIVPEQIQKLPAEQQFSDRTSELAKWLGRQTGLSPMKIEYAIGSEFGTWGRDVMALSQGVNENAPAAALDDAVFLRRFVKDPTRSSDVTTKFWDYMSRTTGKFNQDVAGYNDMVKDAVTRGQPMSAANDFLAKLPAAERAFVTLKSAAKDDGKPAFTVDERRLHPLQNAYDAVEVLNGLRRELATNAQTTFGSREKVQLDPQQRRLLLENVRELAQVSMRNSLAIMGEGGYAGRPILDPADTIDKIRAVSPATADEIATRFATAKVFSTEAVRRAWPTLRDQLVRNGSEADIRSLAFDAKAEGFQFNGQRAKRPGIIRQPIARQPVPSP